MRSVEVAGWAELLPDAVVLGSLLFSVRNNSLALCVVVLPVIITAIGAAYTAYKSSEVSIEVAESSSKVTLEVTQKNADTNLQIAKLTTDGHFQERVLQTSMCNGHMSAERCLDEMIKKVKEDETESRFVNRMLHPDPSLIQDPPFCPLKQLDTDCLGSILTTANRIAKGACKNEGHSDTMTCLLRKYPPPRIDEHTGQISK